MSSGHQFIYECIDTKFEELKWLPHNFGRVFLSNERHLDALLKETRSKYQNARGKKARPFRKYLSEDAPQLCMMLIFQNQLRLIDQFYEHGITDSHFPLQTRRSFDNHNRIHIESPPATLHIAREISRNLFADLQNKFFVPVLEWKGFDAPPLEAEPPYLGKPRIISTTDFSIVSQTRVHQHHIALRPRGLRIQVDEDDNPLVAIKQLLRTTMTSSQFETLIRYEYNCLSKLRSSKFDTPHLIKAAAFYRKDDSLFFVFPWATHGNLSTFWTEKYPAVHDQMYVKWLFGQILGLARTVQSLHDPQVNIRHGDLKPENILCFESSESKPAGTYPRYLFVISDVGLAKEHERLTQFRSRTQQPGGGTMAYAAPEMETHEGRATSRRYDIWSLGCIYLEFIIWLLYGVEGLKSFSRHKKGKFYMVRESMETLRPDGAAKTAEIHPVITKWISDAIDYSRTAPNKDSAISRLLVLIRDRLLVIDANPDDVDLKRADHDEGIGINTSNDASSDSAVKPIFRVDRALSDLEKRFPSGRAYADEVHHNILEIMRQAERQEIEWIGHKGPTPRVPESPLIPSRLALRGTEMLDDPSKYIPDEEVFDEAVASFAQLALIRQESNLCTRCRHLPLFPHDCTFEATMDALKEGSSQCDLCRLLCHVLEGRASTPNDLLRFYRVGSTIRVNNQQLPAILSLYTPFTKDAVYDSNVQIGHPELSDAGDSRHVGILSEWLRKCDQDHECTRTRAEPFLPTRLLDVSFEGTNCRLIRDSSQLNQSSRYLALSHRWGTHPNPFLADKIVSTYESNIQSLAEGIEDSYFPPMYQDAIAITRKLGIRYLWVDSLCIIQAEPGNTEDRDQGRDFLREASKMELVFSSAYATIAATCAMSPVEHFLKSRPKREYATIPTERGLFYLAEVIDRFSEDIEGSELNMRGWVFQERALSRRTIFFAEKQTYWECGRGIKCETLTRTENIQNSILGDANFPFTLPDFDKGKRIKLYQALYERYTRLTFTYSTDRPIAIRGLESRLIRALGTSGGYGVFQLYLRRGLLWQREGASLTPIDFSRSPSRNAHEFVPSWSWMAYAGPIHYMDIPAAAEWGAWHADVTSPWEQDEGDSGATPFELRVLVRNVVNFAPGGRVILDEPHSTFKHEFKCVVVGSKRAPDPMQAEVYYALIVTPLDDDEQICQRAGVAFLKKRHIDWRSPALAMRVR